MVIRVGGVMNRRIMYSNIIITLLLSLNIWIGGCSDDHSLPSNERLCTPSDAVELEYSLELLPGCECGTGIDSLPLQVTAFCCMGWDCVGNGDTLIFHWVRPDGSIGRQEQRILTISMPGSYRWTLEIEADTAGIWRASAFRNGDIVSSRVLKIY